MDRNKVFEKIKSDGLLPLFYHDDAQVCIAICETLYKAEVACVEFTNRGIHAVDNFKMLVEKRNENMPGLLLGIGTVSTAEEATIFIENGADFLVSPFFDEGVNDVAKSMGVPYIPGCMTPGDIHVATRKGCTFIKLFPGVVLGPEYIQAIKPVFSDVEFIVTGGVENSEDNLLGWFNSGVVGVGMGSKLITNAIIANGNYSELLNTTSELLRLIKIIKDKI